ncbi:MAG: DUF6356 family protein [Patescibacteria group bacterium]
MNVFTDHPASAGETYREHAWFAFRFGVRCFAAGIMVFIHAVLPFLFKTGASSQVRKLYAMLEESGRNNRVG